MGQQGWEDRTRLRNEYPVSVLACPMLPAVTKATVPGKGTEGSALPAELSTSESGLHEPGATWSLEQKLQPPAVGTKSGAEVPVRLRSLPFWARTGVSETQDSFGHRCLCPQPIILFSIPTPGQGVVHHSGGPPNTHQALGSQTQNHPLEYCGFFCFDWLSLP